MQNNREIRKKTAISTCVFRGDQFRIDNQEPAFIPQTHLPILAEAGFNLVELCYYAGKADFDATNSVAVDTYRRTCYDLNIQTWSIHTPEYRLNSTSWNDNSVMDPLFEMIDFCQQLHAQILVTHYFPDFSNNESENFVRLFDKLITKSKGGPVICVETLQNAKSNKKLGELLKLTNPDHVGIVIDTGHSHIAGDLDNFTQFHPYIKSLHVHDNNQQNDQHLLPGKGTINWRQFCHQLNSINYQGPYLLEVDEKVDNKSMKTFLKTCIKAIY